MAWARRAGPAGQEQGRLCSGLFRWRAIRVTGPYALPAVCLGGSLWEHSSAFHSLTTVPCVVGRSCELVQEGKERWRLADEKPHVGQEVDHAHSNAVRFGRSND